MSEGAGILRYELAAATNLGVIALYSGQHQDARRFLEGVIRKAKSLTYVRLGALDSLALLEVRTGHPNKALSRLDTCSDAIRADDLPARSWYDLAHQLTRCTYFEQGEQWTAIVETVDAVDAELARRQYKAVRTSLLCAKARALAHLGETNAGESALGLAVRACPRGAVDPMIALEATKAVCATLRGDDRQGSIHFDRALAACRAIGHRYHEWWIERDRDRLAPRHRPAAAPAHPTRDVADTALVVNDIATVLGAGHSIDLLTHRTAALLESTALADRVEVENQSALEYRPYPTATAETTADGTFTLTLRGSDRRAVIRVRRVEAIGEVTLLKGLADLVHAAVTRTTETDTEDEDLTLWPRSSGDEGPDTVFRSPRMTELLRVAERLAATNLPILITGETGTGKDVLARLIHDRSPLKRAPFVPFNCSALPRELVESQLFGHRRGAFTGAMDSFPGVIRAAEHGTLFLDEIADLDPAIQPKFLRFLESGEILPVGEARAQQVPVRVITATNANLDDLVQQGRFRRDLYYRVGVTKLHLPPLRERKDEIPALAALFVKKCAQECGRTGLRLGDDLIAALLLYDWPGNIRQLVNEIRRVAAMAVDGQVLGAADLAPDIAANWNARPTTPARTSATTVEVRLDQPLAAAIEDLERQFIQHAMDSAGGRVAEAAQLLGLSRKGLFLKRRRRGLVAD
jgi:transcriptional regulator with PAS, ATPase and Fis domain